MLRVVSKDGVKDPIEAEHWVNDHDQVVRPARFEGNDVPQKSVTSVGLEKRKIHEDIPERGVEAVYQRERNEKSQILLRILDPIDAEEHTSKDTCRVFSAIDKVRKNVLCVSVTSDALQKAPGWVVSISRVPNGKPVNCFICLPNWWQAGEEAQEP